MASDSHSFFRPSSASWKALGSSPSVCAPSSTVIVRQTIAMLIRVAAEIRFMATRPFVSGNLACPAEPELLKHRTQSLLILLVGILIFSGHATLALPLFIIFTQFQDRQRVQPAPNRQSR